MNTALKTYPKMFPNDGYKIGPAPLGWQRMPTGCSCVIPHDDFGNTELDRELNADHYGNSDLLDWESLTKRFVIYKQVRVGTWLAIGSTDVEIVASEYVFLHNEYDSMLQPIYKYESSK